MSEANKDEAFKCLDIARAALKSGDTARAEKFANKALKLYRCEQVQIFISEMTRGGNSRPSNNAANHNSNDQPHRSHEHHHQQQQPPRQTRHSDHQQQQQHQQQPRGMGGEGLRQRHSTQHTASSRHSNNSSSGTHSHSRNHSSHHHRQQQQQQPAKEQPEDPSVTPEQRRVVQQILSAKTFYEVLGVNKDASDSDIKQAYKKLALRLHPDKNKARHADEAFKLLSKAFSCLSNSDKRAYYDRTGYESTAAAQAAAAAQRNSRRSGGTQQQYYYTDNDFDPEEIFNMFFGGSAFGPGSRVFRSHFGGAPMHHARAQQQQRQQQPSSREEQQRTAIMGLLQLLPVLLIVGLTIFSTSQEPVYSLAKDAKYPAELVTGRAAVTFYVKDSRDFGNQYPPNTHKRIMLERQVESEMYERMFQRCQSERMAQHRAFTWGNRETARKMELLSCKELSRINEAMNGFRQHATTVGGYY